jgi:preprotein translocase subunit SecB
MKQNIPPPQFEIVNILCLESQFIRSRHFDDSKEIEMDLNVDKTIALDADPMPGDTRKTIVVDLRTTVTGSQKDGKQVYSCMVLTVGVFVEGREGNLDPEKFANINAPAILYAFQREYIANLSQKAGVSIFLPPINFVQFHHNKTENENP